MVKIFITRFGLALTVCFFLGACAHAPDSILRVQRQDLWGDRGEQVFTRDYAMCATLIEQRRSLLPGCMQQRGWILGNPAIQ